METGTETGLTALQSTPLGYLLGPYISTDVSPVEVACAPGAIRRRSAHNPL
ncbi:hypothetical protein SCLCIDRAFT_34649 [Scleroderma citrinum Foug A]|uniref:Uncharacterized protein n=1 Tax=Scleroderma citrinum Foug A TaxID=1036808 RepID=A0A0C2YK37_9AGAM|nr:hypothetical protein SCLCIDRAFT_34649 [Scleroderma citrinum Foug A]